MRCVIYSADAGVALAVIEVPILIARTLSPDFRRYPMLYSGVLFDPVSLVTLIGCAMILTYRLSIAYSEYLRFPQAAATCCLAQSVTLLALLGFYLWLPLA